MHVWYWGLRCWPVCLFVVFFFCFFFFCFFFFVFFFCCCCFFVFFLLLLFFCVFFLWLTLVSNECIWRHRLAPVVSAFFICHSLSVPAAVFVPLIPFYCFTTETTLSFPLRDITYQSIITCTSLYTFEKKRENDRKDSLETDYWRHIVALTLITETSAPIMKYEHVQQTCAMFNHFIPNLVNILHKSTAGRHRSVMAADGPITACCRFMKNASLEVSELQSSIFGYGMLVKNQHKWQTM